MDAPDDDDRTAVDAPDDDGRTTMTRLLTLADAEAVARQAAGDIAHWLERARERREPVHLALSGGKTPARTYELLAQECKNWEGIEIWFVDERCVPPDHEQSNYRLAAETLLGPAGIAPGRVHRMQGELGPEQGARRYEAQLRAHDALELDLAVLGIGPEGHIASLFPNAPTLGAVEQTLCLGVSDSPKPPPERITLSLPMLRAARDCLLIASGSDKAGAIAAMLGEPSERIPASLLARERLSVIVDEAAASLSTA